MPLLNYTTEVPASRSIGEIMSMLQQGGAGAIMIENGPNREVTAISFYMQTTFGRIPFTIPANVPAVLATIGAQIDAETAVVNSRRNYKRKLPKNLADDKAHAERVAWRIAKDWLEAQLAIAEIGSAKFEQIMLPFATIDGKSFYQRMIERGTLALPPPSREEKNVTRA